MSNDDVYVEQFRELTIPPLVLLSELPGVGERTTARVLRIARERGFGLGEVLALPPDALERDFLLPAAAVERLNAGRQSHEEHCRSLWQRLQAGAVRISHPGDSAYPVRWHERTEMPPPVVYVHGNPSVLDTPTVAALSSRTLDARTVTTTIEVVRRATQDACTVVSGGMKSSHRVAAVTVRATGAGRAVVLDRGLFAVFGHDLKSDPFGLGPGRAALDLSRNLVLSTFRPYDHAAPANGRRRDRLIADLADIVVAVHARAGGEIESVCLRALDSGRCVLSWHGENAGLVAAGAVPIDEADLEAGLRRFL